MILSAAGKPEGCKLLRVRAEVTEPLSPSSVVLSLSVNGDFFAVPEEGFEEALGGLAGTRLADLAAAFDEAMGRKGVQLSGITGEGLFSTLRSAIDE